MAGRGGRGGAGRGRGRGATMSFSVDQLGVSSETIPGPVTQPPPLYPPMLNKPVLPTTTPEMEYMLTMKKIFVDFYRDSPAFVHNVTVKSGFEKSTEPDIYQSLTKVEKLEYDWKRYPHELRPAVGTKRKRNSVEVNARPKKRLKKIIDIESRLVELEKREGEEIEETEEKVDDEEDEDEDEKDEDVEDVDAEDEEMDFDNDYSNNYFDNGENYLDEEEDNLDDEPVY